jgi:hypothetical protein
MTDEQQARAFTVIGKIIDRADDEPHPDFNADERRVWILGWFHSRCLNSGFGNFFRESLVIYYDEILRDLRLIGAAGLAARLEESKQAVLGDKPVPYDDIESLDQYFFIGGEHNEELLEKLDEIEDASRDEEEEFHDLFMQHLLDGIEAGKFEG